MWLRSHDTLEETPPEAGATAAGREGRGLTVWGGLAVFGGGSNCGDLSARLSNSRDVHTTKSGSHQTRSFKHPPGCGEMGRHSSQGTAGQEAAPGGAFGVS